MANQKSKLKDIKGKLESKPTATKFNEISPDDHQRRSNFVQALVKNTADGNTFHSEDHSVTPKNIVQFWHNKRQLPADVEECIGSWKLLERCGFVHSLFDQGTARTFISLKLGKRYANAFDACYHPAMQADYFRLCYIFLEGGFYVDADDVHTGLEIDHLFNDGKLKLQPLCYDTATDSMVPPSVFVQPNNHSSNWIYYFNNNPLIASARHPILEQALSTATRHLELSINSALPEIQSTTGPGNLTKSIFDLATFNHKVKLSAISILDWESIATTKWLLEYRNDTRNWRLSNRRRYADAEQGTK